MPTAAPIYTAQETAQIADTIRSQISVGTFMALGASHLGYTTTDAGNPAFCFIGRIIPAGQRAPRRMSVVVEYLPGVDLYDITVWYLTRTRDTVTHYAASKVHAQDLSSILFALDREG